MPAIPRPILFAPALLHAAPACFASASEDAPASAVQISVRMLEGSQNHAEASNADIPALAGSWSQASTGTELVIGSKIKFQPSMATGYGTNLGGTFGPGSATNTTIVPESAPLTVRREMNLTIRRDGTFTWQITRSHAEGKGCTKTVTQRKEGRIATSGGKMTFSIQGGQESWSSCGKSGSGPMSPRNETYGYGSSGGELRLSGPGGVDWRFRRS